LATLFHLRHAGHQVHESLDAGAGAAGRDLLEEFADRKKKDDYGRLLGSPDCDCANDGDAHQRFNGEWRPGRSAGDGSACDRHQADHRGHQISPEDKGAQSRQFRARGGAGRQ